MNELPTCRRVADSRRHSLAVASYFIIASSVQHMYLVSIPFYTEDGSQYSEKRSAVGGVISVK